MINGSIATRYSRALFEEARAQFIDKDVYEYMNTLYDNMQTVPHLQAAIHNPRVAKEKKFRLLVTSSGINADTVSQMGGNKNTLYTRFLRLVLEHQRENHLRTMILVYREIFREYHQIDHIIFETATKADESLLQKVEAKVHALTGRGVELEAVVRPELIGGCCLRVADLLYDYSYRTRLQNIRKQLWNK
ncbi:MAG: ATP synthase F1 subunit delta [Bacteroidaceae bacterium]|nr:ATP synthase F1 subunit delta [Bacteroidaceae bacterium]